MKNTSRELSLPQSQREGRFQCNASLRYHIRDLLAILLMRLPRVPIGRHRHCLRGAADTRQGPSSNSLDRE